MNALAHFEAVRPTLSPAGQPITDNYADPTDISAEWADAFPHDNVKAHAHFDHYAGCSEDPEPTLKAVTLTEDGMPIHRSAEWVMDRLGVAFVKHLEALATEELEMR